MVRVGCRVDSVRLDGAGVRITYEGPDGAGEIRARTAIIAVPAPHLPGIFGDAMRPDIRAALGHVTFGPMVVLSILTDETSSMPWDDLYSRPHPGSALQHVLQPRQLPARLRAEAGQRDHGLRGGRRARALLGASEEAIRDAFLADLDLVYPQVRRHIAETWVKSWEHAGPFAAPDAGVPRRRSIAASQAGSSCPVTGSREFVSMETAALTAVDAAANVLRVLGAQPAPV